MSEITAHLSEIYDLGGERVGILDLPDFFCPDPGQYIPAQRVGQKPVPLPEALFSTLKLNAYHALGLIPEDWFPGDQIALRPPQGKGFVLPDSARFVGLLAVDVSPLRLLALVEMALAQNAAVTLFSDSHLDFELLQRLPSALEICPVADLKENLSWPDFLAVDIPHAGLGRLAGLVGVESGVVPLPFSGQILVRTSLPCHGLGTCGVCAVETSRGWRLACVDGPVFALEDILHVAE